MILNQAKLVVSTNHHPRPIKGSLAFLIRAGQFPNGDLSEKLRCKLGQWLFLPYSLNAFLLNILPF